MAARRLAVALLATALLLGLLPIVPIVAANEGRDAYDAVAFKLAAEAIVAAQGQQSGATWKSLDKATRKIVERRIQRIKDEREALAKDTKVALAEHRGKDEECERAAIERAWKDVDARLEHYLKRLRHTRGDKRSEGTRIWRSFQHNALKPLEKLAKRSLPKSPIELIGLYLSGGSAAVVESVKRKAVRVVREDLLMRVAAGRRGRNAATSDEALRKACADESDRVDTPSPSPAPAAVSLVFDSVCGVTAEDYSRQQAFFAPLPPYDAPATLIFFDWAEKSDVLLTYGVVRDAAMFQDASAVKDPAEAAVTAGCSDGTFDAGGIDGCWAAPPIVLTESEYPGAWNWASSPGTYSIALRSPGVCRYRAADGEVDNSRMKAAESREGELAVAATLVHYRAGEGAPYRVDPPLSIDLPRGPTTQEVFASEGPFDMAPHTRFVGPLEWNPAQGVTQPPE